ncbi:U8-agatoxin-Ao1a-like isoform X4 [Onthophagus taurus]|uniref:U8-agatoxin-Ao1a-like isoform X4 n=1 Tax=Onthophagus taurus TaxID=166361 RepID=UPI000C1FE1F7|nr:U8-agatoxin-Ao1a-like isoform X3 [Onthophagus taurus]
MRSTTLVVTACVLLVVATLTPYTGATPYFQDEDEALPYDEDYIDNNALDRLLQSAQKRACIKRGGNCDHRPNDCCFNSSCRCNLWGSNCRCQRVGLFQKWG